MKRGVKITLLVVIFVLFSSTILHENVLEVKAGVPVPEGKIVFVDDDFTDDPENHKWNSIQEGIDDAEEGDIVYVFDGVYGENIFVDKSVEIVGRENVTIDGMGALYTVNILSDGVELSNLLITNGGIANLFLGEYSDVSIEHCTFWNGSGYGVFMFETEHTIFKDCTFMSNVIGGLLIRNSSYIYILDSVVTVSDWGMVFENSSNNYIDNVSIMNIENKSISIRESSHISIFDCIIFNSFCGVRLRNSTDVSIDNCGFLNNVIGIRLDASSSNTVRMCDFDEHTGYGICISEFYGLPSINNTIYRNFFFENANDAYDECSNSWNTSIGNYWANYRGIDENNDGIGDTPCLILGGGNGDYMPSMLPFFPLPYFVWVDCNFNSSVSGWQFDHFDNIQDGVDTVGENGTVYVFNGTYNGTLKIERPLSLIGESNVSLFSVNDGIFINADNVIVSGFSISAQVNGIKIQNADNVGIYGCSATQGIFGLYMVNSFDCNIENSEFYENMKGMYLFNSSRLYIFGDKIHNNSYFGIEISHGSSDNQISDCQIENNGNYGVYIMQNSNGNRIYHNNFVGNTVYDTCNNEWNSSYEYVLGNYWSDYNGNDLYHGKNLDIPGKDGIGDMPYYIGGGSEMDSYPLIHPITNPPLFVWVNPDFNESFSGWDLDHLTSIDNGVMGVIDGGGCFVFTGVFEENVEIDRDLYLSGIRKNQTIVEGNGMTAFTVTGNGVEIHDLGIRNCWNDAGVNIIGNDASVFDCNIYDNYYGIYIHATNTSVERSSIHGNSFTGVMADNMQHSEIKNCSIYENNNGIVLSYSAYNVIEKNDISSNSMHGLRLQNFSNHSTIFHNSFEDNIYGLYANRSSANIIYLNDFIGNVVHATDTVVNSWNNSSIGNYWDDYGGIDANKDGIGDEPYRIDENNIDNYPLISKAGLPIAYFNHTPLLPSTMDTIHFTDKSTDLDGSIISWKWDFGDGNTSYLENVFHRYGDDGMYVVNLTIVDNDGNSGTVSHEVYVANVPPTVNFSWVPPDPTDMDTILFTDDSEDYDGMVVNWTWDFGDGNIGYGSSIMHNYSGNDTYVVTLTASDDDGDSSSLQKEVLVSNEPPVANFSYSPISPTTSDTIHFNDTSEDADGILVNWTWDFDDGNTSYEQNPIHSYADGGMYIVTLTIRDEDNGTANVTECINVSNVPPVTDFSFTPSSPRDVDIVHFNDNSYDTDGSVVSWYWEFGDGHNSTLQNPTHTYPDDGTYTINLTVIDDDGASSASKDNITVRNVPPTADFYYVPPSPDDLDNVSFYDLSSDADGNVVSYSWEFGDGNTSNEQNPSHTYANNGIYTVKLTVKDDDGASDPVLHSILISNLPPVADFNYTPDKITDLDDMVFTGNSTDADGTITNYTWNFGDGNTSYEINVTHRYSDNGIYNVTLTVTDDDGTSSSATVKIEVLNVKPVAEFSYEPEKPQEGKYVSFEDLSTDADGIITNGTWNFGDGFIEEDGSLLSHRYDRKGIYDVKLTVTDDDGAISNVTHTITVKGKEETSGFDFVMLVAAVGILLFMWRNKKGIWRMR